jgi:hypothetical protein
LPEDPTPRGDPPQLIPDADFPALLDGDLARFPCDGNELDPGTVVEFLFVKGANLSAVFLRPDCRAGGAARPPTPGT